MDGCLLVLSHEFIKSGDVIPVTIAGRPILLIKNNKMKLQPFIMFVVIDALKLVNEKKNVGKIIQLSLSSWTYDLRWQLKSSPILVEQININHKDLIIQIMDLNQYEFIFGMIGFL